jgi:MFS family permease
MPPLGDILSKQMNLTNPQFATALSCYAISAGISGFLTAGFAYRFDRKKLLLFFYVGFIVGTFLCSIAPNYLMLASARIVTGLFGGVIGSISMAIVADLFTPDQRGRAVDFIQMSFGASQVLGIPISLFLANYWGWQSPFILIVALSVIMWGVVMLKLKPVNAHLKIKSDKNPLLHLWHTLANRNYRLGFLSTALLSLGGFLMMPWGSKFSVNNLNITQHQLPMLFMVSGLSALLIMPLMGRLSDKIDRLKLFAIATVWMIIVVQIYTRLTPGPFAIVLLMNVCLMIGIMIRMVPSMALVSMLAQMQDRGAFMSINSSLQQITVGVASVVGGLIVYQKTPTSPLQHYDTLGVVISLILVIALFMVYPVSQIVKKKAAEGSAAPPAHHAITD